MRYVRIDDGVQLVQLNRNIIFLIVGALIVVVAVLGYQLYQDRKQPKGTQINIGPSGITIEKK